MPLLREASTSGMSPYLAQHVDNPVHWWMWGEDALAEATRRDCPIFLSIGYAACHWCHVMAHESFEDPVLAGLLNENFLAIKVDREERPDLDQLYMAATQLISGHGGWPMSVFLLPDGRPFTAGTYYPPSDRYGQVGFDTLLHAVGDAWRTRRGVVEDQARAVHQSLSREISFVEHLSPRSEPLDLAESRVTLARELVTSTDDDGGSGAPRFPRPSYVDALLATDERSREVAHRILSVMSRRGLFDHLDGGFARYSVDAQWHVPHFEKMLSDQALLARTYFNASRVNEGFALFADVARHTVEFVQQHLRIGGGYAASLDADAAGIEGSHITWTAEEVATALDEAGLSQFTPEVLDRFCIRPPGDLEGRSVPRLADEAPFTPPAHLREALAALTRARHARTQPTRDTKVILEWNAMFARALFASRDPILVTDAMDLLMNLESTHFTRGHWWRTETCRDYATATDIAWLTDAFLDAFEVAGDDTWLNRAYESGSYLIEHYWDGAVPSARTPREGGGVFATSDQCVDIFTRPKDVFDGATPSSHAVATSALSRLALCRGDQNLMAIARRLVELAAELIATHPRAVPDLLWAAELSQGIEVVVPGDANVLSDHVRSLPMLRGVLISGWGASPLLSGRQEGLAYVCQAGSCRRPVASVDELRDVLEGVH